MNIFGGGKHQPQRNRHPLRRLSHPIDLFAVQPGEELLLALRIEAVDLIEKQHAAVCRLKRPGFIALRAGKRAFDVAKQVGGQQLRVAGVLGAVEADKGRIGRQQSLGDSKLVHQLRHIAFAGSAVADDQQRQPAVGIKQRGFHLFDRLAQATVMAGKQ